MHEETSSRTINDDNNDLLLTNHSEYKPNSIFVLSLTFIIMLANTGAGIVFPIFPKYLVIFGGGPTQLGYLAAIFSAMVFLFSTPGGWLADKIGRRLLLFISMLLFSITNIMYAEANSLLLLYVARGLEGISVAGVTPVALSLISEHTTKKQRSFYVGIVNGGAQIGFIIGPVLGGIFFDLWGLKAPFYISAGLGIFSMLMVFFIPKESPLKDIDNNTNEKKEQKSSTDKLQVLIFSLLTAVSFSTFFSWALIEPGFSFYVYDVLGFTPTQFGLFVAIYASVVTVGQPLGGYLGQVFHKKLLIIIGLLIYSLSYLLLIIANNFYLVALMGFFAGVGNALTMPIVSAEVTVAVPSKEKGTWLGVYSALSNSAGFLGPIIGGAIYPLLGPTKTFIVSFSIPFSMLILILFLYSSPSQSNRT